MNNMWVLMYTDVRAQLKGESCEAKQSPCSYLTRSTPAMCSFSDSKQARELLCTLCC
jgi:hypothetical protein